jgi:cytochrome c biogenesis protein CcmG, thiol:disulfide interchange protein DsbE
MEMLPRRTALTLLAIVLVATAPALAKAPAVGDKAPNFTVRTLSGQVIKSSELAGKVVVVNFWATWCAPCREELPLLNAWAALNGKHGLVIIGVTQETSPPYRALRKVADALSMPIANFMRGDFGQIDALPTNFVIDRAGVVRYAKAGAFTIDQLNALLIPLLNEPAPAAAVPAAAP